QMLGFYLCVAFAAEIRDRPSAYRTDKFRLLLHQQKVWIALQVRSPLELVVGIKLRSLKRCIPTMAAIAPDIGRVVHTLLPLPVHNFTGATGQIAMTLHARILGVRVRGRGRSLRMGS